MSFRNIDKALDNLDALYHAQINSFDEEALPDLETQTTDRKLALAQLKKLIETMLPDLGDQKVMENLPELEEIIRHIQILQHQNSALKARVMKTKEDLQKSMSRIHAGKQVINAYGSPKSVRNRPKVLTLRN